MVRIVTGIYTVKIYQGPVCIVEDIIHLDIVMGSADTIFWEDWKKERTYRLYKKVQLHRYVAKNSTGELTILFFLANWKMKKAETYKLFETQPMLLSATSRKGQPDPDLQPVQNPEHALVSTKQEGPARSWLTSCSKPRSCSFQQQAGRASQILTYSLSKTQSMLLSVVFGS